jgi:hypothetical protein
MCFWNSFSPLGYATEANAGKFGSEEDFKLRSGFVQDAQILH